jgi:glutamine amidotransferase
MIGIIDYGMGNLGSVKKKLERINSAAIISEKPEDLEVCEKLVLPGVGHFSAAVKELKTRGLWDFLNEAVLNQHVPILGICLGMQLMAKHSKEGDVEGLGWFDAEVVRFDVKNKLKNKVPHIGWNHIALKKHHPLFNQVDMTTGFYFVHAYHLQCKDENDILSLTDYEYSFVSAVQRKHIIGLQYHPEKSHDAGEQIFRNFSSNAIQACLDPA